MRVEGAEVTLFTRNGHEWTKRFPELSHDAALLPDGIYNDELVALGETVSPSPRTSRRRSPPKTPSTSLSTYSVASCNGVDDIGPDALMTRKASLRKSLYLR